MKIPDLRRQFRCKACAVDCYHRPIAGGNIDPQNGGFSNGSRKSFQLMRCEHCKNITLCIDHWVHPGSMIGDAYIERTEYYPPLTFREKPNWFNSLDKKHQQILSEVYLAIDNSLFTLASSGVRTALDRLIIEKIGDVGTFEKKIKSLVLNKIITEEEKFLLISVIDAGSASSHRGFSPDEELINHIMEITEHIFYKINIEKEKAEKLKEIAEKLAKATPRRGKT